MSEKTGPLSRFLFLSGGLDQDRTDDLLNAIEALYQLSYEPVTNLEGWKIKVCSLNARSFLANLNDAWMSKCAGCEKARLISSGDTS
jgi:hypothetical protein